MTDRLAGLGGEAVSAEAPGSQAADIERIKAELRKELEAMTEDRIKGFQRVIGSKDTRIDALEKELRQLKTASLSPEELEELEGSEKDRRIQELEAKLELRQLSNQYGEEMPFFERLLEAETAEDQLKVFREYRSAFSAPALPPAASEEQEPDIPDVDPNGARSPASLPAGTQMTDELADQLLRSFQGSLKSAARR